MKALTGKLVGALCLVRLGRCQWGSKPTLEQAHCTRKTRSALAVPVIDCGDMIAIRLCGEHLEAAAEALRA